MKDLMEYVGWKDIRSAMRYIDRADPFAKYRIEPNDCGGQTHYALPLQGRKEVKTLLWFRMNGTSV
ncbi:MAG: hypothetical protein N838_23125 [Thiohalocapsa sp. PB-PSB1]|nr:MAG: hypothetical protein N838_23125 [Thiohalocapsa sp. PB-PSB1]